VKLIGSVLVTVALFCRKCSIMKIAFHDDAYLPRRYLQAGFSRGSQNTSGWSSYIVSYS
jgi:hypothetical protein